MLFKTDLKSGVVDVSDLRQNKLVMWQHRHYFPLALVFGVLMPTIIPGVVWGDWVGGLCYSGAFRLTMAHHVS